MLGQIDGDRDAFVDGEHHLHLRLQVRRLIADDVGLNLNLVVVRHVHEVEAVAILIEILKLKLFNVGALDLIGGLVALHRLHAVRDAAHIDLGRRRALAGVEAFRRQYEIELALDIEDVAFADRTGDDFHGDVPWAFLNGCAAGCGPGLNLGPQHTHLELIRQ